jgi:hypothetical protein
MHLFRQHENTIFDNGIIKKYAQMKYSIFVILALCLCALQGYAQTILGCTCPPPCAGYEFNNTLPGCNVNIRYTLYDNTGAVCATNNVTAGAGITCILPCPSFAGCIGPFNIAITIIDIDGVAIPTGTPNSIDHTGLFGSSTGSQTMPAGPCSSATFVLQTLPSGCGAEITP